jgi:stage V sporulation protein G
MATRKSTKIPATTTEAKEAPIASLQVTQCQVYLLKEKLGKTRAMVRIIFNDCLQMTGIRIVDGAQGLFVAYPNDPGYKGDDYRSLFYPLTRELREHVEEVVLEKYSNEIKAM